MVLAGKYRLEESLGSGGMAEVFRALELTSGRRVAVKVLRAGPDQNPEATARLKREGQVLRSLKNPAIVGIEDVIELEGGRVILVMELLVGETLGARMRRGKIEPGELGAIVAGVAVGLSAAHANGVVHRDLKPDNIFLGAHDDGRVQVKLLDFGVSKIFGGERLTQTGQVLGTPRYMSPEQLGAEPEVDHRVDIYSLGVILYEALTGKPPFLASTPTDLIVAILHGKLVPLRSLRPDLPASIEGVVMRAMARVRDARFRAATELAEAFFEAAGIEANARALPRAGMATTPLGSMKTGEPGHFDVAAAAKLHAAHIAVLKAPVAPAPAPPPAPLDPLAPGTFSELPAFDEAKIRAEVGSMPTQLSAAHPAQRREAPRAAEAEPERAPAARPVPLGVTAPATDVAVRSIPRTAISMMEVPAPSPVPLQPPHAVQESAWARPGATSPLAPVRRDPSGASSNASIGGSSSLAGAVAPRVIQPPSAARGRLWLAGVGLAAGAISAGVAIALLTWLSARDSDTPPPPPPPGVTVPDEPSEPTGEVTPTTPTTTPTTTSTTTPTTEPTPTTASTTTPTTEPTTTPATPEETAPPRTPRTPRERPTPETTPDPHEDPPPIDPISDPLGAAQRALAGGDPEGCVQILDDVLGTGGTPIALRRRADCLMRASRPDDAIRDYQRFCRIAPDHPAISEVRELLEGMGRTCP